MSSEAVHYARVEWTEAMITRAIQLRRDGLTHSQIARDLGNMTRNAVIGKLERMVKAGLAPDLPRVATTVKPSRQKKPPKDLPITLALAGVPPQQRGRDCNNHPTVRRSKPLPVTLAEPVPFANGARVTIMQLTSQTCKWPIGDPGTAEFCFCGHAPREASPYCEFHARAAYVPRQDGQGRAE
jgi:GcrA cell cycle regulator